MTFLANMIISKIKLDNRNKHRIIDKMREVEVEGVDIWFKLNQKQYDELYFRKFTSKDKSIPKQILEPHEGVEWIKNCICGEIT